MRAALWLSATLCLLLTLRPTAAWAGPLTQDDLDEIKKAKEEAVDLFNQGRYEKAITLLEKVLSMDPDDKTAKRYMLIFNRQVVEPYCKLAAEAYLAGDYPEAVSNWENILKINPRDKRVAGLMEDTISISNGKALESLYANSNRLMKEGRLDLAMAELEKILAIDPGQKPALEMLESTKRTFTDSTIKGHYDKAELYSQQGEHDLAIEEWKKILEIDPSQDIAARMIASVHRKTLDEMYAEAEGLYRAGNYIASRDSYNRLLAENPTDQNIKGVIARLGETIKVTPQLSEEGKVWDILRKGLSHHISPDGNATVAVTAAWYAAQLEPENTLVLAVRDFIEGRHVSVIRSLEPPVKDMDILEQYLFASLNHIYEGRYDLAIQECSIVLELEPENVLALKRLGSAYFAMGRKAKARQAWEKALELSPKDSELKAFIRQTQ